jgi:hypothetical protein
MAIAIRLHLETIATKLPETDSGKQEEADGNDD